MADFLISWATKLGAVNYRIEYKRTVDSLWTVTTPDTNQLSRVITGLLDCTSYDIRVKVLCVNGTESVYYTTTVTTGNCCANVTNLTVAPSTTSNSIGLSWTASPTAISYRIAFKRSDSPIWSTFSNNYGATAVSIPNLDMATLYNFRVISNCSGGQVSTGVIVNGTTACLDPNNVVFEVTNDSIYIEWDPIPGAVAGNFIRIYYAYEGSLGPVLSFVDVPQTSTNYTLGALESNKQYTIRLCSLC